MDRKNRHRKPKFVTQGVREYILQIHRITEDTAYTVEQRIQALNRTEKAIMREFGFYSEQYRDLKTVIDHCKQSLVRASESRREVLYERDSGRDCVSDPCID